MILLPKNTKNSFFWILKVSIYGLRVIGLAPFSQRIEEGRLKIFRLSRIGQAYNILLLFLLQILDALALPTFFSLIYPNSSSVTHAIDVAQGVVCAFTTYVIIAFWIFGQKNAVLVMNKLLEIDRLISGIEKHSKTRMIIFFVFHMIFSASLWFTSRVMGALLVSGISVWIFYSVSNFIIYWFIVEYFFVLNLVARDFERVNKSLLKFAKFSNYLPNSGPCAISFLINADYNGLTVSNFSNKTQIKTIKLLLKVRTTLYEVSKDIADFFSLPILFAIGYSFFLLVYNVYYLIYTLLVSNSEPSLITISNGIAWILTAFYPIILLSLNVTKTVKKAKQTGLIVHKLLATTMIQDIKVQLKQFSLQLLHERIRFTAYGFFELDCTMLHSILEATATYNVILIQFSQLNNTSKNI